MEFWLVDVLSTITINGKDVAFDFINTHFTLDTALEEAKHLSKNNDVLRVQVHKWIKNADGSEEHAEGDDSIPYSFDNENHRERIYLPDMWQENSN